MTDAGCVLIVEDNPRNLKLVRDVLDHADTATLEAATAEEGIALARASSPDWCSWTSSCRAWTGSRRSRRLRAEPETADDTGASRSPRSP